MKILCVSGYYKPAHVYGGPTYSVPAFLEGMSALGADVCVLTTNANGPTDTLDVPIGEDVDVEGVTVKYYPLSRPFEKFFPFYSRSLQHACSKYINDYDVAYLQGFWPFTTYAGARAALLSGIPYVITPHGEFMEWSIKQSFLKKQLHLALLGQSVVKNAAAIHTTCTLETNQTRGWISPAPIIEIPNSIDLSLFSNLPEKGNFRKMLDIPPDGILSIFVGRLHRMKRIDLTITAFSRLREKCKNAHLAIIGADEDGTLSIARQIVQENDIDEYVHFTGLLPWEKLIEAYVDADILVLLSHRENFGMVVAEAMAAGVPVLITNEVGLSPEVGKYQTGYTTPDDADLIVDRWLRLVENPEIRHNMGKKGIQLVRDKFSSRAVASEMLEYMNTLL